MSAYPPPPGVSGSSTPPANLSSLPQRPPPPAASQRGFKPAFQPSRPASHAGAGSGAGPTGFTGFAPRAVASTNRPYRTSSPAVSAGPQPPSSYSGQSNHMNGGYQSSYQQQNYYQQGYQDAYAQQTPPQIRNPFAPPTAVAAGSSSHGGYGAQPNADPDMEAQIAQWQSAYLAKDENKQGQKAGIPPVSGNPAPASSAAKEGVDAKATAGNPAKPMTVQRSGGGQKWSDSSLLEWDPAHHRIFVGNLAGEVTDDSLLKAFAKYPSVQKARVIRDKRTTKSKGYGFVSFSDGDDYFKAARDMQNKYIGSHPVKITKANTEIKPVMQRDHYNNKKGGKGTGNASHSSQNGILGPSGGGITKKPSKTKGGLRILG